MKKCTVKLLFFYVIIDYVRNRRSDCHYAPTINEYDSWFNKVDRDVDRHLSLKFKEMGVSLVLKAEYKHPMIIKPLDKAPNIPDAIQTLEP